MIDQEDDLFRKSNKPKEDPAQKRRKEIFQTVNNLARSGWADMMEYIIQQEDNIKKAGFDVNQMQTMRRNVSRNIGGTVEDLETINRVFGPLTRSNPTATNVGTPCTPPAIKKRTPTQEIEYRVNCTYETFYDWLMDSNTDEFLRKLTEDQMDLLSSSIDNVIMFDYGLPRQRHYEDGDEQLFRNRLKEVR